MIITVIIPVISHPHFPEPEETDDPSSHLTEQTHYLNVHNGPGNGYKWFYA